MNAICLTHQGLNQDNFGCLIFVAYINISILIKVEAIPIMTVEGEHDFRCGCFADNDGDYEKPFGIEKKKSESCIGRVSPLYYDGNGKLRAFALKPCEIFKDVKPTDIGGRILAVSREGLEPVLLRASQEQKRVKVVIYTPTSSIEGLVVCYCP